MNKIISGILITLAGSVIGSFAFSADCSTEILDKATPFLTALPGLVVAWFGAMGEKGRTFFGSKKV